MSHADVIHAIREHLSVLTYCVQHEEISEEEREQRSLKEIRAISRLLDRLEAM